MTEGKRTASDIKALAVDVAGALLSPRSAVSQADCNSRSTDNLRAKRRFAEAGRVLLEYGRDVEAAVGALVEGAAFAEALRLVSPANLRRASSADPSAPRRLPSTIAATSSRRTSSLEPSRSSPASSTTLTSSTSRSRSRLSV